MTSTSTDVTKTRPNLLAMDALYIDDDGNSSGRDVVG